MSDITLSDGVVTLALPGGLLWSDEHSWNPVEQVAEWSLTGALLVDASVKLAGRPITLEGDDDRGWVPLTTVNQLVQWARTAGKEMTLVIKGQTFDVAFRTQDVAVEAEAIYRLSVPDPDWPHVVTIRLMEI